MGNSRRRVVQRRKKEERKAASKRKNGYFSDYWRKQKHRDGQRCGVNDCDCQRLWEIEQA